MTEHEQLTARETFLAANPELVPPLSIVTLKRAVEGRKQFWLAEAPDEVASRVNDAPSRVICLTKVEGFKGFDLWISPDNVDLIEPYK